MNYSTNWIQTIMVRLRSRNICRSAHQHQTTVGISDTPLHPPRYLACYCSSIYCSMKLFLVYSIVDQQYVSSLQYLNFCVVFSLSPEPVFFYCLIVKSSSTNPCCICFVCVFADNISWHVFFLFVQLSVFQQQKMSRLKTQYS